MFVVTQVAILPVNDGKNQQFIAGDEWSKK